MDKKSTEELILFILESISHIQRRFKDISSSDDFLNSNEGLDKLDAIAMRIQALGEALKNIYKKDKNILLTVNDDSYWREIIRARDFISHHYVDLDSEVIYDICLNSIDELKSNILKIKDNI